jgi:hypothetical protein
VAGAGAGAGPAQSGPLFGAAAPRGRREPKTMDPGERVRSRSRVSDSSVECIEGAARGCGSERREESAMRSRPGRETGRRDGSPPGSIVRRSRSVEDRSREHGDRRLASGHDDGYAAAYRLRPTACGLRPAACSLQLAIRETRSGSQGLTSCERIGRGELSGRRGRGGVAAGDRGRRDRRPGSRPVDSLRRRRNPGAARAIPARAPGA